MSLEGLDCWDDYPMEHGCICGNDCEPPSLPLDPTPWLEDMGIVLGTFRHAERGEDTEFSDFHFLPRPGYAQNREGYAS